MKQNVIMLLHNGAQKLPLMLVYSLMCTKSSTLKLSSNPNKDQELKAHLLKGAYNFVSSIWLREIFALVRHLLNIFHKGIMTFC